MRRSVSAIDIHVEDRSDAIRPIEDVSIKSSERSRIDEALPVRKPAPRIVLSHERNLMATRPFTLFPEVEIIGSRKTIVLGFVEEITIFDGSPSKEKIAFIRVRRTIRQGRAGISPYLISA